MAVSESIFGGSGFSSVFPCKLLCQNSILPFVVNKNSLRFSIITHILVRVKGKRRNIHVTRGYCTSGLAELLGIEAVSFFKDLVGSFFNQGSIRNKERHKVVVLLATFRIVGIFVHERARPFTIGKIVLADVDISIVQCAVERIVGIYHNEANARAAFTVQEGQTLLELGKVKKTT